MLAQVPESLNHERKLTFKPGHRFRASVFEVNPSAPDPHCVIRAIGEVDGFRGHWLGKTKGVLQTLALIRPAQGATIKTKNAQPGGEVFRQFLEQLKDSKNRFAQSRGCAPVSDREMGLDIKFVKFVKFVELQRSECEIRHIRSAGASVQRLPLAPATG